MTRPRPTTLAALTGAVVAFLLADDLIAAGLGKLDNLSAGQIAWRAAPLIAGGFVLALITIRPRRAK